MKVSVDKKSRARSEYYSGRYLEQILDAIVAKRKMMMDGQLEERLQYKSSSVWGLQFKCVSVLYRKWIASRYRLCYKNGSYQLKIHVDEEKQYVYEMTLLGKVLFSYSSITDIKTGSLQLFDDSRLIRFLTDTKFLSIIEDEEFHFMNVASKLDQSASKSLR